MVCGQMGMDDEGMPGHYAVDELLEGQQGRVPLTPYVWLNAEVPYWLHKR